MDDCDQDYLTEYRVFFDDLYQSVELSNPLPVHIGKYNIAEFEITGEIISWCLEYLNSRKCPSSLIAPLCRSVQLEMGEIIERDPESCGYRAKEDDYQTLKLMQSTIKKLVDVCLRYRDNSKLCCLPPPPPVTPSVSASAAKNIRRTMEDRHIVINDLHALFGIEGYGVASYYAVFDGHNGSDAAIYACSHVYQYLVESRHYPDNPEAAFKEAFIKADDRFIDKSNKENLKSGTTAVCILIRHDRGKVYVAWLGDSQAILVNGRDFIQLVNPHRPDHLEERDRIESMGGSVVFWGTWRVNGQLAVSRSIGDVDYKPYVTGEPDVSSYDLTGDEDFLLLACDGLWDVVSEQLAVDKVYEFLQESKGDRSGVSKSLVTAAKSLGSKDNISVVVAWLDMSTLENGHFGQEPEIDVTDDLLPPALRSIKPSPQITTAPQRLDESAEKWLKTLPWSYADVLRKPAPKKEELVALEPAKEEPAAEPVEVPATPQSKGEDSGDVAGEADSGEDSEEEWNYISGKENRQPNQLHKEELSQEDMESQLNPNAAEFVPVYSAGSEPDIASSPRKGMERNMEDIQIPTANDFFKEISKRPSDIGENDTSINGDGMSNLSTKAVFGDDSICLNSTVDSLSNSEQLKVTQTTNPFVLPSQVPNFVQDHFSLPELGAQANFSLPDIEFKRFSQSNQESEINFMAGPDKVDLLSPSVPLSDPKIKVNESSVSDVSEITFGDVFNVEDIIRSKQDSPLLRESPEPGLGLKNESDDVTPEEQTDKISEFSPIKGVTNELEDIPSSVTDLLHGVSSHQGPETSVDSDPEQDDVLVSPMKKEQNGIDHVVNKIEETNAIEKADDFFCELKHEKYEETDLKNEFIYQKHEEDLLVSDEKEVCCLRQADKKTVEPDDSEVIPENNGIDKNELVEDVVEREQIELQNEVSKPVDAVSNTETIDHSTVLVPSKELLDSDEEHIDTLEANEKLFESDVSQPIIEQSHHELSESNLKITHSDIPESSVELTHTDVLKSNMEPDHNEVAEQSMELNHSEVPEKSGDVTNIDLLKQNLESPKHEISVTTTEFSQSEVLESEDELMSPKEFLVSSVKMSQNGILERDVEVSEKVAVESEVVESLSDNREIQEELQIEKLIPNEPSSYLTSEEPFSVEVHAEETKPTEDTISVLENEAISSEGITLSTFKVPVENIMDTKSPIEDDVCVKQEVHEELICPIKLSPLTNKLEEQIENEITSHQEVVMSDLEVNRELDENVEDSRMEKNFSLPEKKDVEVSKDLIYSFTQEEDLCRFKAKVETAEMEEVNVQSYFFGTKETAIVDTNKKQEELDFMMKSSLENKIEDYITLDSSNEKDSAELLYPLRRTPEEEEIIKQESEDAIQNSSLSITDEMSSSMIDHGEEKALPEAQSNQLDLVQELQFEVHEKQTEVDTESDSGFEIINASEASTIEMEMRYQSEKEAGAINEKLLMDRNEAEPSEKPEELVNNETESNFNSNNDALGRSKQEELIMPLEEEIRTVPSPKHVPEPLERPVEPESLGRTADHEPLDRNEMVNGTVTPPATPPATPAPGLKEETKEGLIAAAVAAAGVATAVAAGSAAVAVSESKVVEKKSPVKKTDSLTSKVGVAAKVPSKVAATKGTPTKAPMSKPTTPISKPSTPSSKSPAKPTSPTTRTITATKTSALAAKPSTPTSKVGAKPSSKPSTPTGTKTASNAAAPTTAKPKPAAALTAKSAVTKTGTSTVPAKKPPTPSTTVTKTALPSTATKSSTMKPTPATTMAKPLANKPTATKTVASSAAAKPATKLAATKAAPTTTRPGSAKSTSNTTALKTSSPPMTKPPAKPALTKTTSSTKPAAAPASKPPAKAVPSKTVPSAPISKKPAAPTAIKKPAALTDKSTKEASNKLTAKTTLNKKIEEKKIISKKEVIGENEEPPAQVAIVTTTNGHISLIENGIPSSEIVAETN